MKVRRVVTGHNAKGEATVASDTEVDGITVKIAPGTEFHNLWGADKTVKLPDDGSQPITYPHFPSEGGFRFTFFTVPPTSQSVSVEIDTEQAMVEMEEKLPGMAELFEEDNPVMHTSDTIDCEYVISGEVWLELDNGGEVHLKAGDTVVQNGTRHAWRNKSTEPCVLVAFLVGANRI